MDQMFCVLFIIILHIFVDLCLADHEYMVKSSESIVVPFDFETTLQCEMNIEPDKFQWKFYPLPGKDAYNPKALIDLSKSNFVHVSSNNFTVQRKQSDLTLRVDTKDIAGDYQCLAYYGASVVASVPWRITIATLGQFPKQNDLDIVVVAGNTVNWRCELPESNPEACIDYYKNEMYYLPSLSVQTKSLILTNVNSINHTGHYKCRAINTLQKLNSPTTFNLNVVNKGSTEMPYFIMEPKKVYTVNKGDLVFLECSAVGNPIPQVVWQKKNGQLPSNRADMINGGLIIKNVTSTDDGTYICTHTNIHGTISYHITLIYNEEPTIDCMMNSTDVKQGEHLDIECDVKGVPEPKISWFLNGYSVSNDSGIEAIGNRIYFRPTEKRHAGNLQIFARNIVKTIYNSISIKVIPLSTSVDIIVPTTKSHHRHNNNNNNYNNNNNNNSNKVNSRKLPKHTKMVPPNKPSITRLNDESVVVRWSVPMNKGLPIQFFKVQYRELGPAIHNEHNRGKGSRWKTMNADIAPHINSYEVNNLKPDHIYKFRIAAVYSNNDNKLSANSDKFYLRKLDFDNRNPLPIPLITQTETINSTAVKIYWTYIPVQNISIDGFFINYISSSSAADYMKETVDGEMINSYILTHLQPDTLYDIKLQSFTMKTASEFSSIMKAKTSSNIQNTLTQIKELTTPSSSSSSSSSSTTSKTSKTNDNGMLSKLYITIAGGVLGGGVIISGIALLFLCRKWKQKKNRDVRDNKTAVDDHHIQADNNDYVVNAKSNTRSNGCNVSSNRITITANPLADADNKNQNMIEMSCLSNNNCSQQPSVSGKIILSPSTTTTTKTPPSTPSPSQTTRTTLDKKDKKKRIRNKHDLTNSSGENYV